MNQVQEDLLFVFPNRPDQAFVHTAFRIEFAYDWALGRYFCLGVLCHNIEIEREVLG